MKPLLLIATVEDQIVNKTLVDGGVAFNILPRSMLHQFRRSFEDLIPHNIVVLTFMENLQILKESFVWILQWTV